MTMRRFILIRRTDPSGVSGTGVVAHGVEYDDGYVSMQWCDSPSKIPVAFPDIDTLLTVHGHGGKTIHRWLDPQHQAFITLYPHARAAGIRVPPRCWDNRGRTDERPDLA